MSNLKLSSVNEMYQEPGLSTPEEEYRSCFHGTPKHNRVASLNSCIASQDSIDVYHDALSIIPFPQRVTPSLPPILQSPSRKYHHRRRHFSSEAKIENERICWEERSQFAEWDESVEQTCLLPKNPVARVGHSSQGPNQVSRSCNGSPFHVPRLSFSTNSLRRKSVDVIHPASPQKMQGVAISKFSPHTEVEMIQETDESERNKRVVGSSTRDTRDVEADNPTLVGGSAMPTSNGNANSWRKNYVPCVEFESMIPENLGREFKGETQIKPGKMFASKSIPKKGSYLRNIKEEFAFSNFKLEHRSPHLFVTSQWQQPNQMCCIYLAYRLFWGVYFTMWGIWSFASFAGYNSAAAVKAYYFLYLTNWAIWLLVVDTTLQAINVILHTRKISVEGDARYTKMKKSVKCSWILSNITSSLHIFIAIVYWSAIFPYRGVFFSPVIVNTHITPCVYVIIDCLISATPRRIFHAYLPMVLLTIYGVFTDIYYLAGGLTYSGSHVLYPIMDWSEPTKTLLIGSAFILVLIPLIHIFIVCIIYGLRVKLWRNLGYVRFDNRLETLQSISMEEKV